MKKSEGSATCKRLEKPVTFARLGPPPLLLSGWCPGCHLPTPLLLSEMADWFQVWTDTHKMIQDILSHQTVRSCLKLAELRQRKIRSDLRGPPANKGTSEIRKNYSYNGLKSSGFKAKTS